MKQELKFHSPKSESELMTAVRKIKHVALDMDGTIYMGKTLFPFTTAFLSGLKAKGIGYSFLTNNPSRSIDDYLAKLEAMEINAEREEMYTSSLATIDYIKSHYFVRKNFSMAMPGLEANLGISKVSLGIFLTLNGLIYGLSRFVNGIIADRLNARFYMAIGLALCAIANFAFGFGEDISFFFTGQHSGAQFTNTLILFMGITWVVNGLLQGAGFPPCARLLTHWIPPRELATKMSVWNTSHSIGAGLVVILCGFSVQVQTT